MKLTQEHYYNTTTKFLLKALGIWHHDKSRFVFLQRVMVLLILVPFACMQFSVFFIENYTITVLIRAIAVACPCILMIMMYIIFVFKSDVMLNIHKRIEEDWMLMRDNMEHDIIQENAHSVHFYLSLTFSFTCFVLATLIVLQFLPIILDVILPLDKPRQFSLVAMESLASQNKYFYTVLMHEIVFAVVFAAVTFSTSMQLVVLFSHSFGMFKIARHRIRYLIEDSMSQHVSNFEHERVISAKIKYAVKAHRRALEFSNIVISSINAPYCVIAILGMLSLSINLFGLVEAITVSKINQNAVFFLITVTGQLVYLFAAMLVGQRITDCNDEVFNGTYSISWYLMPVSSQKLLVFLLQKSGKEFCITIGFLIVAKIENFAAFINASLSYVAVMYSCAH
ncbi:uncharacterized protein LOC109858670 [Pseudomyrmex gracilis]|uniref:uncharacterized protein LOC109858670 n=1 Tax=Pseudomyrmex gracilis TaxID=219809 RepID=UPI00099549B6|nr:uncharacterized protein LOC109858670 [Pseudomyrmex gracilis]